MTALEVESLPSARCFSAQEAARALSGVKVAVTSAPSARFVMPCTPDFSSMLRTFFSVMAVFIAVGMAAPPLLVTISTAPSGKEISFVAES